MTLPHSSRPPAPGRRLACVLIGAIFLWAGLGKAAVPGEFLKVVWYLLPEGARTLETARLIGASVIAWEVSLGAALVLGAASSLVLGALLATLLAFSGVLIRILLDPAAPSCGCLAIPAIVHRAQPEAAFGLVRNAALLGLGGWVFASGRAPRQHAERTVAVPRSREGGFSLLELLVVILIIMVLLAIVLPAMRGVRYRARTADAMSLLRQLSVSVQSYGTDYQEYFPWFATKGDPFGPVTIHGFTIPDAYRQGYFHDTSWYWASFVYPDYFDAPREVIEAARTREFLARRGWPDRVVRAFIVLTENAFAHREYWMGAQVDSPDVALLGPTRLVEIQYPSSKGILLHVGIGLPHPANSIGEDDAYAAFGDGSARPFHTRDINWDRVVDRPHGASDFPVLDTREGLAGIDF